MRIFDHPTSDFLCPICGKNDDKPVILAGIAGTEDGNVIKAMQIHADCIDFIVVPTGDLKCLISQPFGSER